MSRKIPFVTPVQLMKQPRDERRTTGQCKRSSRVVTHVASGEQGTQSFPRQELPMSEARPGHCGRQDRSRTGLCCQKAPGSTAELTEMTFHMASLRKRCYIACSQQAPSSVLSTCCLAFKTGWSLRMVCLRSVHRTGSWGQGSRL